MHANKCHANVRWFMEQDVSGLTCGVTGWLVQWPDFILHSVLEAGGRMMCITPGDEAEIEFIPDPKISWVEDGEVYSAVRDGQVVGIGVRAFPSFTMARNAIVRERLLAGIDPYKAIQFSDEDMKMLKRQHIERAGLVRDITAKLPGTIEQE